MCADSSTGVWRLHHDASTIPSHQEIGCYGRQRGHRNCGHAIHATALHPLSPLSASLAASAQLAVKWEKLSSERMPTNDPSVPLVRVSASRLWWFVVTGTECSRLRWMPLNFKYTLDLPSSLPPFPHRLSAIALFLLPSPSS